MGFRLNVFDTNETNVTRFPPPKQALGNSNTPATQPTKVAAGYRYLVDAMATIYKGPKKSAEAYYGTFKGGQFTPPLPSTFKAETTGLGLEFADKAKCVDKNTTLHPLVMVNSRSLTNSPTLAGTNAGRYNLWLSDADWTLVDQARYKYKTVFDPNCNVGSTDPKCNDCKIQDTSAIDVNTSTKKEKVGCTTSSVITGDTHYNDIPLSFQPYLFDLGNAVQSWNPDNNGTLFMTDFDDPYYTGTGTGKGDIEDMAAITLSNVIARGKQGLQLTNFTRTCAAEDVNLSIRINDFNGTLQGRLRYGVSSGGKQSGGDFNLTSPQKVGTLIVPKNAFGDYTAPSSLTAPPPAITSFNTIQDAGYGSAAVWLYTTLRKPTKSDLAAQGKTGQNPVAILYRELNATGEASRSRAHKKLYTPIGNQPLDTNVTFLFARMTPGQMLYVQADSSKHTQKTELYVNVYCDLGSACIQYNMTTPGKGENTPAASWYLADMFAAPTDIGTTNINVAYGEGVNAPPYTVAADGKGPSGSIQDIPFDNPAIAEQEDINVSVAQTGRPTTAYVYYPPVVPWLIYGDKNTTYYRVKFLGPANWSGVGNTGKVTGTDSSYEPAKRMNW
jgi:hypothetical protein